MSLLSWAAQLDHADRGCIFRNLIDADVENRQEMHDARLCVRVSLGTYRLFYVSNSEDCLFKIRTQEEVDSATAQLKQNVLRQKWLKE